MFPYGSSESFLETEIQYLAQNFEKIIIVPLEKRKNMRTLPPNVEVCKPILNFSTKNALEFLIRGIFNFSPVLFTLREFFEKNIYSDKYKFRQYSTYLLLFRSIYANKSIWKMIKEDINPNDILYFYWGDKSMMMLPFIKEVKNKVFVRFHGSDLYDGSGHKPFRKEVFKRIDVALTISDNGSAYLRNTYGSGAPAQIIVSRLGVLNNGLNPVCKNECFHILTCSNVIPLKRLDLLVSALMHVNEPVHWTHIGTGPDIDILKSSVKLLPKNINAILTGSMSNADVINFYKMNHIDLFINVSETEGVPVSIMEALSFGVPVLATNVGGTSEIVDSKIGLLVEKNLSPTALAKMILFFYYSSDMDLYRQNAKQRWLEYCNAERNYLDLCLILKK